MTMNLPNKLTILRVLLIPIFLVVLLGGVFGQPYSKYIASGIFVIASLTDALDGHIARSRNLVTNFGKFMDPLADKLLVASAIISMIQIGTLPAWVVIIIISREFIVTGFRLVAVEQGLVIAAGFWGKLKTAVTMVMIVFVLINLPGPIAQLLNQILIYGSVILTIVSAIEYIFTNIGVLKDGGK